MKLSAKAKFERTILPHLNASYHFALSIMRHPQDAEDVVQDAYIRAYRAADQFTGGNSAAWIMKIVRNVCMTQLNKSNASKVVYIDSQILKRKVHQYQRDGASEYASPEMDAIALTEANKIHDAIAQLSIEYREIILLREFQDFSYKQIAEVTTLPVGTVMSRLSRARRDLRNILSADVKQEKGA